MRTLQALKLVLVVFALLPATTLAQEERRRPEPRRPSTKRQADAPPYRAASAEPAKDEAKPATTAGETDKPFNPLGDPSRFTRYGGWGGIGSTLGQFGMARSMLVMMPAVQEELGLTDDQKQAIRDWTQEIQERGREMAEGLRQEGQEVARRMDVGGMLNMLDRVGELLRENEAGIARILNKAQRKRLNQIALQMEGITGLARPDVAQALNLTDEQAEGIQLIIARARMRQIGYWMQQGLAMRERMRRESRDRDETAGDDGVTPKTAARTTAPSRQNRDAAGEENGEPDTNADDEQRRAQRRQQFRTEFEKVREGADAIQEETVKEILKVLAPAQRRTIDRLLGPPFDPNRLTNDWTRRRRNNAAREADGGDNGDDDTPRSPHPTNQERDGDS